MTIKELAQRIARFVVESGRASGATDEEWAESLEVEVEFEARERGYENSEEIAAATRK